MRWGDMRPSDNIEDRTGDDPEAAVCPLAAACAWAAAHSSSSSS